MRKLTTAGLMVMLVLAAGCEPGPRETGEDRIEASAEDFRAEMSEFRSEVQARLDRIAERLEALRGRLAGASAEGREDLQARIEALEDERMRLRERLQRLEAQSQSAWERLRVDINQSLRALERSIDEFERELENGETT